MDRVTAVAKHLSPAPTAAARLSVDQVAGLSLSELQKRFGTPRPDALPVDGINHWYAPSVPTRHR